MNHSRFAACAVILAICSPVSLAGQDQFGRSVAISGGEVFVARGSGSAGPASVHRFAPNADGAWELQQLLRPAVADQTGEEPGPGIVARNGVLLIGGGDPDVRWAASSFERTGGGEWSEIARVPLDPRTSADVDPKARTLDLAGLYRILTPPRRVVAYDRGRVAAAVVDRDVRILDRRGDAWMVMALFRSGEEGDGFGTALAVDGDRIVIGAPLFGESGGVFVYSLDDAGELSLETVLAAAGLDPAAGFGSAVALAGDEVLVGAPGGGAGTVIHYVAGTRRADWHEAGRIVPPEEGVFGFGQAIAFGGDRLWIGAPGSEGGGGIHPFERSDAGAEWTALPKIATPGLESGFRLGSSLAAEGGVVVAGAPGADGMRGRVAVFVDSPPGRWHHQTWLTPGDGFDVITGEEHRCAAGMADRFACRDVDLVAFLPIRALGGEPGETVSDLWGWTDPGSGREFALVGRSGGAAFVEITDPANPVYLGVLAANRSGARDIKVYRNYMFLTGDGAGEHGLLVFDLTRLLDVDGPVTFEPDARYDGIASAHNLVIDTESGFAYPVGASAGGETCGGGLHMIDIRDPLHPSFAGCYTDTAGLIWQGRTHDAQCTEYHGPDERYSGRQICFASNETALRVVDVTDKSNPVPLAAATYPGMSYVHQGWLTEDQRYFYLDDELDELVGRVASTRTLVWDVSELDDPILAAEYFGSTRATDHNLYIRGDRMYQANYSSGLRVVDISDPVNPVEVGFFDSTPYPGNPPGFVGAWTAYPFFRSGLVIMSSMNEGLFVLRPRRRELVP